MNTKDISIPPTVCLDPGELGGMVARYRTIPLNAATLGPTDSHGNLTKYTNADNFGLVDRHVDRFIAATWELIKIYSGLCQVEPQEWFIAVEMFMGVGGVSGSITSRIAHQYAGYWKGAGFRVIMIKPRQAGRLYAKEGGNRQWTDHYHKRLVGKRPRYGADDHMGRKVPMFPNDDPGNRRTHEQAADNNSVYAHENPDGEMRVAS